MRRLLKTFWGIALLGALVSQPLRAEIFNPKTFTLENGLKVVVLSNHRAPIVSQMIWYKVGSADDPIGKSGLAHFLEHLMFKGTPDVPAGEFFEAISRIGGQQNAFTSKDSTTYYQNVPAEHLELIIKLEAGRMANLTLLEEEVNSERDVILEERRQVVDNEPGSVLAEAADAAYYFHYPYKRPIIGWEHEIRGLTREDAKEFYKKWYVPNNATLIFAGDVTVAQVKPLVEKYYGRIAKGQNPERTRLEEPVNRGTTQRITLKTPLVDHPQIGLRYAAPTLLSQGAKDVYPLQVLGYILMEGATSKWHQSLQVTQKIASWTTINHNAWSLGPGTLMISAQPTPGNTLQALERALRKEVQKLLKEGVSAQEVEKAKQRKVAGLDYLTDNAFGGAQEFGFTLTHGGKIEDVEKWREKIEAVTVEQVNEVVQNVFGRPILQTIRLIPEKTTQTKLPTPPVQP